MKTALCLFGKVGGIEGKDGKGGPVDFALCYTHYQRHLIDVNRADVFMHCWSTQFRDELKELYRPKKAIFESQIDFFETEGLNNAGNYRNYSRWYSTKRVIELLTEYYDWVMLGRFDLMWLVDFDFNTLKPNYFYAANWNAPPRFKPTKERIRPPDKLNRSLTRKGLSDLWFVADSLTMRRFGRIYDGLGTKYTVSGHGASWERANEIAEIKYKFYRWWDFELYRWKVCNQYR